MARKSSLPLLVILTVGCQSAYHNQPPVGFEDRLARVEEVRLADSNVAPQVSFYEFPEGRVLTNQAPTLSAQLAFEDAARAQATGRTNPAAPANAAPSPWSDALGTMTLGDLGDQPPAEKSDRSATDTKQSASTAQGTTPGHKPPLRSFWETASRDIQDMPSDLWRDTKRVYANPVNLVILGSTYGGSLALRESGVDRTVEHRFNRNNDFRAPDHIMDDKGWRDGFAAMGNPGTHFALAGAWYLLGQQTMDDKTYEVGKTLFSALIINGLTVVVGQAATYDKAPNGEYGTFPSGHTSSSFVVASVLDEAYGHVVGVPLYGVATMVAIERLDDREHYLSDVVMGAVLGTVVGHSVASGRDPEFFGWKLLPYASPNNGAGVAFMKSLD